MLSLSLEDISRGKVRAGSQGSRHPGRYGPSTGVVPRVGARMVLPFDVTDSGSYAAASRKLVAIHSGIPNPSYTYLLADRRGIVRADAVFQDSLGLDIHDRSTSAKPRKAQPLLRPRARPRAAGVRPGKRNHPHLHARRSTARPDSAASLRQPSVLTASWRSCPQYASEKPDTLFSLTPPALSCHCSSVPQGISRYLSEIFLKTKR